MSSRYVSIWFRFLKTDWYTRRNPALGKAPFVLTTIDHGRIIITAANAAAESAGLYIGMPVADARALVNGLVVQEDAPQSTKNLLQHIAEWCIRFTPIVATDGADGIILDATGCAHLWGSEKEYLKNIVDRFNAFGYSIRIGMADTIGMAWAAARFKEELAIIGTGTQSQAILDLPPEALRIDPAITERLYQLGLNNVGTFINMPRSALRRRFGTSILTRLHQALGTEMEFLQPVTPAEIYQERLHAFDAVATRTGIEIALEQLLGKLCDRLSKEGKGIRACTLTCYRVDNKLVKAEIKTIKPTFNAKHLYRLFENKIETIEPALGIELFILTADKVEEVVSTQEGMWSSTAGLHSTYLSELLDRISGKFGANKISRYLPAEHYWPENSVAPTPSLDSTTNTGWENKPRPLTLLQRPDLIEVTAPIPDYPPMLFRYKGKLHKIIKADGPERIEQEWWLQTGEHRDYYYVEDEEGRRYWLFRSGHYNSTKMPQWYIHGFFA